MRDDRAERALALALTEHETDHDFAPLDLATLRAAGGSDAGSTLGRRRPFWHHLMAAAVVLVVVAPLGGLALQALNARNEAPSAVPASAPAAGGAARDEAAPQPASDTAGGTAERAGGTVMSDGCPVVGPPAEMALEPGTRPTTAPLEQAGPVESVTVCQYADVPGEDPNLVGERLLEGAAARAVVDALGDEVILADPLPACRPTRESLVLRINGGESEAWLPLDGCRIPVFDTGSSMHFPTRATCADLLVGELSTPVFADPVLAEACGRR